MRCNFKVGEVVKVEMKFKGNCSREIIVYITKSWDFGFYLVTLNTPGRFLQERLESKNLP